MSDCLSGFDFLERLKAHDSEQGKSFDSLKKYLCAKAAGKGIPLSGMIELTPLCNFDCKMCYTHLNADQLHGKALLTAEQWNSSQNAAKKMTLSAVLSNAV